MNCAIFYVIIQLMEILNNRFLTMELYRGDTYENFQVCSVKGTEGRIFFDRRVNPAYHYKETYASRRGVADAFSYALRNSRELGHTPIVISGRFPILSKYILASITSGFCVVLPDGVVFPVDKIWLPKADFNWRGLNLGGLPKWLLEDSEILNRLELFDPSSLVDKHPKI